jgi:hypothetical protein
MGMARTALGLLAGGLLLASAAAHSFVGWPAMAAQLDAVGPSPALRFGLAAGWHFGGAAMLIFGTIVVATFVARWRGRPAPLLAPRLIAAGYLAFGVGALLASGLDPFGWLFVVPGTLLAAGAWRAS